MKGRHVILDCHSGAALDAARRADSDLAKGGDLSPLLGLSFAVKDICDVAGLERATGWVDVRLPLPSPEE